MAMSLNFTTEENVSERLEELQKRVSERMESILREVSYQATGKEEEESAPIPRLMGRWNHWLFISGQLESARSYDIGEDKSTITINYSGMRYEEFYADDFKSWWEFAEDNDPNPLTAELERDYAFYQETGIDEIASPVDAKHEHAIEWGLLYAAPQIRNEAGRQFDILLERYR